jgi:branched-chain amino acid transport system substrate-binding protein
MKLIKHLLCAAALLGVGTLTTTTAAFAQAAGEPIKIGVPMPLTGPLAQGGRVILSGIQFAADEANRQGGVLGHKIELVIEDTKGEPNTAAIVANKMLNQDKVFAFAGGYGSTADFAMLQSIKRAKPIFVHMASSSVKIEQAFGADPWYFHVYIVDYHRQKAATSFFESITPKPKNIAIAYEDGLYGSDAVRSSQEYLTKAGFNIVMKEPFKTGSPDLSPILNRVKSSNADVFFIIGYSGDSIQMVRQARSLNVNPKLMMIVTSGEKRDDFAEAGTGLAVIGEWAPEQKTAGLETFLKNFRATLPPGAPVLTTAVQGYTGMKTLLDSIRAAGALDHDKVIAALDKGKFATPYGELSYGPSEQGGKHQLLTDQTMIVWQYRAQGQEVVWPAAKAGGKLVYPAPGASS